MDKSRRLFIHRVYKIEKNMIPHIKIRINDSYDEWSPFFAVKYGSGYFIISTIFLTEYPDFGDK